MDVTRTPEWRAVRAHAERLDDAHLRDLFAADPGRAERLRLQLGDVELDLSKHRIDDAALAALVALAEAAGVAPAIERMFAGDHLNTTEDRAVLHVALRAGPDARFEVDGVDVMPDVRAVRARLVAFAERVRSGAHVGFDGRPIRDVVHVGIGGSDLGPKMATQALSAYAHERLRVHFVSNVDPSDLSEALAGLDPATTLVIVASKTFTTQETMANARAAREWLVAAGGEDAVAHHFVALSTNVDAAAAFGVPPEQVFGFWDWVGGRYSVWSAIGLPLMLSVGPERFEAFLAGAERVDRHLREAPLAANAPVLLALLGVWYANFFEAETHAVLPYDHDLVHLPAYLQQADMESNGKSVTSDGHPVTTTTGPIVWGQPGTNGQHAFYQLLHQGTRLVPVDFLVAARSHRPVADQHELLIANALAQAEALMVGRPEDEARAELAAHGVSGAKLDLLAAAKTFEGNRPSSFFLYPMLTPEVLGTLIALYEHKIFVQGVIWGVNSFDQMGVELGKVLATRILPELDDGAEVGPHDASTRTLIERVRVLRGDAR
ncbi:MAG: glucose-6-phosphate isomerase [Trueperaceae bacterium]